MSKVLLVAAAAAGYVMGSRAGREHYEIIRDKALELWQKPEVQEAANQATEVAKDKAGQVKDQVAESLDQSRNGGGDGDGPSDGVKHSTVRAQPSTDRAEPSTAQNLYPGSADGTATPS
ncbi:hypothetical protein [Dietzia lutea]|uniref:YtxH domain-containing protein n=1 Tax=Dietzia lutea TaxID=546160 RepID=A0A2S1R3W9_9ACTN|nr:hypothetical protein [Dietzia lutea]AWH90963.1 hypothetical protein A6035_00830 [Dietzia lutea]